MLLFITWSLCATFSAAFEFSVRSAYLVGALGAETRATSARRLSDGDLVVGGNTNGVIGSGNTNRGSYDWVIQRLSLSASGVFTAKWTTMLGSSRSDHLNGIAVDSSDNIYVVGACYESFDSNYYYGGADICYAKLDANGNKV